MNNVIKRGLSGLLYVIIIIISLFYYKILYLPIFSVILCLSIWEFLRLFSDKNNNYDIIFSILISLLIFISYVCYKIYGKDEIYFYMSICFIPLLMIREIFVNNNIFKLGIMVLSIIYVVIPLILLSEMFSQKIVNGFLFPLAIFIFIWINDTFAYIVGISIGKHKLFSSRSPHKTWEGAIGGVLFTILGAYIIALRFDIISIDKWLLLGVIVSIMSILGDLFESLLKRVTSHKDSGAVIPGHGGILDRLDSFYFAVPYSFLYLKTINVI